MPPTPNRPKIDLTGFSNPLGESNAFHGLRCPPASFLTVGGNTLEKPDSQAPVFVFFLGGGVGVIKDV